MNVYDFDGTIYSGDSGVDFIEYVFKKKPLLIMGHLMKSVFTVFEYKTKKISFSDMKGKLFSFVSRLDDIDTIVDGFARTHKDNIKNYYKECRKDDDVIVSASLDFYLLPLCKAMKLDKVICTKYDVKNGRIIGENCKGEEKVNRFNAEYGENTVVENSYGDSKSDIPILKRAHNAFIIRENEVTKYAGD